VAAEETDQPQVRAPAVDGAVVNYYFPVEIEVIGDSLVQRVVTEVFTDFDREMARRQ
jgi:hypothetical protein